MTARAVLGPGLRRLERRSLAELGLRVAVRAREEVAPSAIGLQDGLTDEAPALALGAQRWFFELLHDPSTALRVLVCSMQRVSVDEPGSLREGGRGLSFAG